MQYHFQLVIITIPMFETSLTFQASEPALSQFPVTHYSITCTTGEEEICSETVPANTTSVDLTVVAGVQYTITVSALSNGRESQNNPQHNFGMFSAFLNVLMDTSCKMSCFYFVVNYRIYIPS